jgi:hypothetical protein
MTFQTPSKVSLEIARNPFGNRLRYNSNWVVLCALAIETKLGPLMAVTFLRP